MTTALAPPLLPERRHGTRRLASTRTRTGTGTGTSTGAHPCPVRCVEGHLLALQHRVEGGTLLVQHPRQPLALVRVQLRQEARGLRRWGEVLRSEVCVRGARQWGLRWRCGGEWA